jgi:hypothetical protein
MDADPVHTFRGLVNTRLSTADDIARHFGDPEDYFEE